jgi:small neutral amino acid transporter SnatA (MarC family)
MPAALDRKLKSTEQFLNKRLSLLSRLWILIAILCLAASFFFPLWHINLVAPQYRDGLDLWIYAYQLVGGNEGQDLVEINLLNHYIGMQEIQEADFFEMRIIPFALGFFIVVGLRTIVFGRMSNLIDHLVVLAYFSLFSLATFIYRLYSYGHDLNPRAPIDVEPFWPTLIGTKQIANMTETSMPGVASYLLGAAALLLLLAVFHSRHEPLINESF